jgi:hypothetical protein
VVDAAQAQPSDQVRVEYLRVQRRATEPGEYRIVKIDAGNRGTKRIVPPAGEAHAFNVDQWARRVEVSVSPTGRSVRVWVDGREVPAPTAPAMPRLVVVGPNHLALQQWALSPEADDDHLNRTVVQVDAGRAAGAQRLRGLVLYGSDEVMWLRGARDAPYAPDVHQHLDVARRAGR